MWQGKQGDLWKAKTAIARDAPRIFLDVIDSVRTAMLPMFDKSGDSVRDLSDFRKFCFWFAEASTCTSGD